MKQDEQALLKKKVLDAEMENHLSQSDLFEKNKRNGKVKKTLKSGLGIFEIQTPTDRNSSFELEIIEKR
jgi:transposase-like protein